MKKLLSLFLLVTVFFPESMVIDAKVYKGAEYRTRLPYLYGRFEVRYKPANREGVVSSFFTYHEIEDTTGWNEIDFEFIGRYNNSIQFNSITPGQHFHIRTQHINFDPYSDFHDYAFEWTPDYVAWFVDGVEVYRQTGNHISTLRYPQKIMMNIWNPIYTNWVGYFDDSYLPCSSVYDFVSYSSYTPGSGNTGNDNNFTREWTDDFNSYNSDRWEKATHTFGGNQADFEPENIQFKDGFMYLYLTSEDKIGGVDDLAPKVDWAMANFDSSITLKLSEEISKESAENISNFILPGGTVDNAILSENNLYIHLETQNYSPYMLNNLIYSGLVDQSQSANSSSTMVVQVNNVDSIKFPIKVNVGGESVNEYLADQEWNITNHYGYLMGDAHRYPSETDIEGSEDDEIYRSDRRGLITYKFKLPKDNYNVKLLFADQTKNSIGDGVFSVIAENTYLEKDLDIVSKVGNNSQYQIMKNIEVLDGVLDIYFEEKQDSAFLNGIIIDKVLTDVDFSNKDESIRNKFNLNQNYPNPFNPKTNISYTITDRSHISIVVYDLLGNEVDRLINKYQTSGNYNVEFNGLGLSSGIYYYKLIVSGAESVSKKMLLLK